MPSAYIVLGLVFGDEGKGRTVDALSSLLTGKRIVVRFSGGQQAGHGVYIGDIEHVFSNFGAGTLRGLPSYFSEHCTMYPVTLLNELNVLKKKKVQPEVYFNPLVKVTTPYDVIYNRLNSNQNSCGLGVGATMNRNSTSPYKLFAVDLLHPIIFKEKLKNIRDYYIKKVREYKHNHLISENFDFDDLCKEELEHFEHAISTLSFNIKDYNYLRTFNNIIFEGSQGILLDMDHGIFPDVTYANTTSKNALSICNTLGITDIKIYYVTRCYQTRHGRGWMSNDTPVELINTESEINKFNKYQGEFRIAEFDYDLINHAMRIDSAYSYAIHKKYLCITCLDQRPDFVFNPKLIEVPIMGIIKSENK